MDKLSEDMVRYLFEVIPYKDLISVVSTCIPLRKIFYSLPIHKEIRIRAKKNDKLRIQKLMKLFINAESIAIVGTRELTNAPIWEEKEVTTLNCKKLEIERCVNASFFLSLSCCSNLRELILINCTLNVEAFLPQIFQLHNLETLFLPQSSAVKEPKMVVNLLSSCSLSTLMIRYNNTTEFWKTVATNTPSDKLGLLRVLRLICFAYKGEDSDSDLCEVFQYFPQLDRITFRGTLDYTCLDTLATTPTNIKKITLPWPQKDYTDIIVNFVQKFEGLEAIQIQARDDNILNLLTERHKNSLTKLSLSCTEAVTTDAIISLISQLPLKSLALYFYDVHQLTAELLKAIQDCNTLRSLWMGTLTVANSVVIVHENLKKLSLKELKVQQLEIECPKATIIPPLWILDFKNANEIYSRSFPNEFVIRVAASDDINIVKIHPENYVSELIRKIQKEINPNVLRVIVDGKALLQTDVCGNCLKNGSLVKLLC